MNRAPVFNVPATPLNLLTDPADDTSVLSEGDLIATDPDGTATIEYAVVSEGVFANAFEVRPFADGSVDLVYLGGITSSESFGVLIEVSLMFQPF